jgi:serpin B
MRCFFLVAMLVAGCKDQQPAPAPSPSTPAPPTPAPAPVSSEGAVTDTTTMPPAVDIATLVKANNNFALELWGHAPAGNMAISPLSISTALAMTWAGAKGETADEMRKVMHFEGTTDVVVSQWARISTALQDPARPLTLKMANRLYGDAHYQFDTTYFTITRKAFDAPMEMVDFRGDAEGVRAKINAWVAERTEQHIKDLLPARSVDASTALVIINAIYFLADWADPFNKELTADEPFYVTATQQKKVPTMHRTGRYKLAQGEGAALLELPYKGGSAAMYILLPDKRDGLAELEKKLAPTVKALQSKLAEDGVTVSLPRFTIDTPTALELSKPLQALGMKQAFDPKHADLTGIAKPADESDRLYIGEVLHKAFVKVDEKGTEAAAATAVITPRGGPPRQPTPFKADHPFLFLIADRGSGLILFVGRVVEPKS